jgi:hypothetical protein
MATHTRVDCDNQRVAHVSSARKLAVGNAPILEARHVAANLRPEILSVQDLVLVQ